jgi:predicted PurR-regulated permease PerM
MAAPAPVPPAPHQGFQLLAVPGAAGVVAGAVVAAVCILLFAVSGVLPAFIISPILAYVLDPVFTWLAARRVQRGLATFPSIG